MLLGMLKPLLPKLEGFLKDHPKLKENEESRIVMRIEDAEIRIAYVKHFLERMDFAGNEWDNEEKRLSYILLGQYWDLFVQNNGEIYRLGQIRSHSTIAGLGSEEKGGLPS